MKIPKSFKVGGRTTNYNVQVELFITCNGEPVKEGELKVTWLGGTEKKVKIKDGKARAVKKIQTSDKPTGTAEVTIKGEDGSTRTEEFTY